MILLMPSYLLEREHITTGILCKFISKEKNTKCQWNSFDQKANNIKYTVFYNFY